MVCLPDVRKQESSKDDECFEVTVAYAGGQVSHIRINSEGRHSVGHFVAGIRAITAQLDAAAEIHWSLP